MISNHSIAILVPHRFLPIKNGGHQVCFDLCRYLGQFTTVHCLSVPNNEYSGDANFSLEPIFSSSILKYLNPWYIYTLYKFFKTQAIEVCIVNQPFQAPIAYIACKLAGVQFIVYSHNIEYLRFRSFQKWWAITIFSIEWLAYKSADLVLFISKQDQSQARRLYKLTPGTCCFFPHLIEHSVPPIRTPPESECKILYFGDLRYQPNIVSLENIFFEILPLLGKEDNFQYSMIVCGAESDSTYIRDCAKSIPHVTFYGYVEDLDRLISQCHLVLNPVLTSGGVQTKIIRSLSIGVSVVTSSTGAQGIVQEVDTPKLTIVEDRNWKGYVTSIVSLYNNRSTFDSTPQIFYDTYYWKTVIGRFFDRLSSLGTRN